MFQDEQDHYYNLCKFDDDPLVKMLINKYVSVLNDKYYGRQFRCMGEIKSISRIARQYNTLVLVPTEILDQGGCRAYPASIVEIL